MAKDGQNIPTSGMTDAYPLNVKDNQYPFMLNGNIMTDISSAVTLTNEHSNYLCNNLPTGFVVIGTMFVPEDNIVYLWLVNPVSTASEIGYLSEYSLTDVNDQYIDNICDECVKKKQEATPLEQTTQSQLCVYTPIVTDGPCCTLNFNIDFPIRKGVFKKDNCGDSIYFTDFRNPPRVLKLKPVTHLPDDTQRCVTGFTSPPCVEPIYDVDPTHVSCESLQLFPTVNHIHVVPAKVGIGGTLVAGTYQLGVCYADKFGQRATRTFSVSNPVAIFDTNKTVTDQVNYPTDKNIQFLIENLNNVDYKFIDIFVIATTNGVSTIRQYDTIDISSLINDTLQYVLSDFEQGKPATIDDVMQVFPVYELAQEITTAGNSLLLGNLTGPPDLNLQRAVIGLSPTLRWVTSEANAPFYADGVNAANYRSFLRDEQYPLGIVFERNNTLDTCVYPFVGRDLNTALTPIEPPTGPCTAHYPSTFPGTPLYSFVGTWIPERAYNTRDGSVTPYDVVLFSGVLYYSTADIPAGTNTPPPGGTWLALDVSDPSCYLCVVDDSTVTGDDVLTYPGCDTKTPTPNKRWQVYNTACNSGELCSPIKGGIQCQDANELVPCNSYTYSVPTASATWPASIGPYPANVVFTLTVDPTTLGIFNGASVISAGHPLPAGTIINGAIVAGNTITVQVPSAITAQTTSITVSFDIDCAGVCPTANTCNPGDCYVDKASQCIPCASNYATPIGSVPHCNTAWVSSTSYVTGNQVLFGGHRYTAINPNINEQPDTHPADWTDNGVDASTPCPCPVWPPILLDTGCNPGFVRTKTDALNYFAANGKYLLCIDATLVGYDSSLADPFVIRKQGIPTKILDASDNLWYVYDPSWNGLIQSKIITTGDPTANFQTGTKGPEDPTCLKGLFAVTPLGQPIQDYMFPGINAPTQTPENYNPTNAVNSFNPSPLNKCNDYGPSAPLMYMLGNNLTPPAAHPCGCADCAWISNDYWNIGPAAPLVGEVNDNIDQSYWYSFTATALQPTLIVKSKIFYKFGEILGVAGPTDVMQQGDIRIDVYENSPLLVQPTYSTGKDTVNPAKYFYDPAFAGGADTDTGVLIIGDVANSTGDPAAAGQLPLTVGETYYVHIYMLKQGFDKLDKAPIPNPNKTADCIAYDASSGSCCPCWYANYGWMNLCINSATSDTQVRVSLAETWEVKCEYELYFRHNVVIDSGCDLQTFEFGDFGYWQAETKTYPTSLDKDGNPLWGDLCGKHIRHFKFPDCLVAQLQDQDPLIPMALGVPTARGVFNPGRHNKIKIYPLGLKVNAEDVKAWLLWAVDQGLITDKERLSITGYKIVRGNRAANKSIIAKGLLYDMWKYNEYDWVNNRYSSIPSFYANYPFNDLRSDPFLQRGGSNFQLAQPGTNNRFAFLSPDTTFNNPSIGVELKLESAVFGDALGNFYTVLDHPKYVLLSSGGIGLAAALAAIQLSADLLVLIGELLGNYTVGLSDTIPVGSIVGIVGAALGEVPKFFTYAQQWEAVITDFGVPQNFAKYYAAVGNYHSSGDAGVVLNAGNKRRIIDNSSYLLGGNLTLSDNGVLSKINNYEREDSVYLFLQKSFTYTGTAVDPASVISDNSRFLMSDGSFDNQGCTQFDRKSCVSSFYSSLKIPLPDQYGSLQDIEWLYTGDAVPIDWNADQSQTGCVPIYGGDTFVGPMAQKRKLPYFLDNPVGVLTGVDFQYQHISNITDATYFFNSVGESTLNSSSVQFKPVEYKFDCDTTGSGLYLGGSMYLFSYGIAYFIGESDFNLNFRYATDTKGRDFYPHQSDIENWTQEYLIPIETPNAYLYNRDYSKQNKENVFCSQPSIYHNQPCVTTYRNRVISSIPDTDSDFYRDNWRIFLGGDFFDFKLTNGFLNGLDGIERDKVMLRFAETTQVFNAYYVIDTNAGSAQLGTASLFANKPEEEVKAAVGYTGTESHAFISTPMGHFWVDSERHKVFMMPPTQKSPYAGTNPVAISDSYDTFFLTNLPFYILRDFPNFNVDNPYKDIGMAMDWDYRFNRLFLTKLDYALLPKWKGQVTYVDDGSGRGGSFFLGEVEIQLTDTTYFCNKSWTISFSPGLKTWISFYSFVPNYYIGHAKYLQTGVNFVRPGADQLGIWNHFISNKSYQVFYGTLYPFITDVIVQEQLYNKQLHSIEYQADFLRFQNDYDYFYNPDHTFNKMVIWTENQNSGNLVLVPQKKNDFSQVVRYPIYGPSSTTIMVTRKTHNWRVNQFADLVANKHNNVPPMILGCSPYMKQVNPDAINYNKPTFQRQHFVSDYMTLRFINDVYSNYKIINKWFLNSTIKSYS